MKKRLELTLKAFSPEVVVFIGYVVAFFLMQYVARPIQDVFAPTLVGTLLFLPHGVRVIGAWLFGYRSILPLVLGEVFGMYFMGYFHLPIDAILQGAVVGGVSCFIAFEMFRLAGQNLYLDESKQRTSWRMLILLASIGSVFNSFGHIIAYRDAFSFEDDIAQILAFLVGDIGGTFALLLVLVFFNRSLDRLNS
jgi:hypothetical protein